MRLDQGPVIQTLPVQSVICVPADRSTLAAGRGSEAGERLTLEVKGVAWSGGAIRMVHLADDRGWIAMTDGDTGEELVEKVCAAVT